LTDKVQASRLDTHCHPRK